MNTTISGVSFYDSLNKLTVGWLIILPLLENTYSAFSYPTAYVVAFLVGTIYHCSLQRSTVCFRNCIYMIREQNRWVEEERRKRLTIDDYYKAYYKVAMAGILMNIPTLEATENFIRSIFLIIIIYIVGFASGCNNFCSLLDGICQPCNCAVVLSVIFFMLIPTWFYVQNKIFELVWEGDHYISVIANEKNNTDNNTSKKQPVVSDRASFVCRMIAKLFCHKH